MTVYTDYQFNSGEDYSNISSTGDAFPSGVGIGVEGGQGTESASNSGEPQSGGENAMDGLTSDGTAVFNDSLDSRVFEGMDSMAGVAGLDGIHGEILADEQMYASQGSLPFPAIAESAEPLLQPDEQ